MTGIGAKDNLDYLHYAIEHGMINLSLLQSEVEKPRKARTERIVSDDQKRAMLEQFRKNVTVEKLVVEFAFYTGIRLALKVLKRQRVFFNVGREWRAKSDLITRRRQYDV